jgi:hypothetical protein
MEEVLRRHAAEFDEAFHLLHTVDLIKNGETYRIEVHQKMNSGYRKHFVARHFKKSKVTQVSVETPDGNDPTNGATFWIALEGVTTMADSARDALNQALIWIQVQIRKNAI